VQDSAAPFHDWNERILNECYAPNAVSRILNKEGLIERIVNNYSRISFDFGPTLLSWMEFNAPSVYQSLLMADWESQNRFSGHGSAMAQAYNHMILPLANRRDKVTQIRWGLRDFEIRFGREAEGMWLPETAVDIETLDLLAEHNVRFTLLAPHQATRVCPPGGDWKTVGSTELDTTIPYVVLLPSGRRITVFFYDSAISHAIAFEGLLSNGDAFTERLRSSAQGDAYTPRLVHIATDGESYGHHHRFGEMALAYALNQLEPQLTNYGEFLENNPPSWHVEIAENSSWSCAHGVERWRSNCGCNTGAHPEWSQDWRAPLRAALNKLRDRTILLYEEKSLGLLKDPWLARDDYIDVVLNRSAEAVNLFFDSHAAHPLSPEDRTRALLLLEMQRHAMLAFTSCGWFFDDLAGIEAVQNMQYAARAAQLAQLIAGDGTEAALLSDIEKASSNDQTRGNGRQVFEQMVRPTMVDLPKVGAHYAVSSLFESYDTHTRVYCYRAEREAHSLLESGHSRLAYGIVRITSTITWASTRLCYAMVHLGDQNISGGVCASDPDHPCANFEQELKDSFLRSDIPELFRLFDRIFGGASFSLRSLFRDEQRKIIHLVLDKSLAEADGIYSELFENHAPLMRFLTSLEIPIPRALQVAADLAVNGKLRNAFTAESLDLDHIHGLLEQSTSAKIALDTETLEFSLQRTIERLAGDLYTEPLSMVKLDALLAAIALAHSLPFEINLWKAQNIYSEMLETVFPKVHPQTEKRLEVEGGWREKFLELGQELRFFIPPAMQ
jgi:alpha-amylase/alpha-mannosidase (GH57 family)